MNSVEIVVYGLCLWLTSVHTEITALVPDFHRALPAHRAVLEVPKEHIVGPACPEFFTRKGEVCEFVLNGSGAAGGVRIDVSGEVAERPDRGGLHRIPKIQHGDTQLRMRREYAPEEDGSRLAARMVVDRGTLSSSEKEPCAQPPCARYARWTLRAEQGNHLTLILSNLVGGRTVLVPLEGQAKVTIRNEVPNISRTKQSPDLAHWCLYFSMFEEAGCPGAPPDPDAPPPSAPRAVPPHVHGGPAIETIACSNSQYP